MTTIQIRLFINNTDLPWPMNWSGTNGKNYYKYLKLFKKQLIICVSSSTMHSLCEVVFHVKWIHGLWREGVLPAKKNMNNYTCCIEWQLCYKIIILFSKKYCTTAYVARSPGNTSHNKPYLPMYILCFAESIHDIFTQ